MSFSLTRSLHICSLLVGMSVALESNALQICGPGSGGQAGYCTFLVDVNNDGIADFVESGGSNAFVTLGTKEAAPDPQKGPRLQSFYGHGDLYSSYTVNLFDQDGDGFLDLVFTKNDDSSIDYYRGRHDGYFLTGLEPGQPGEGTPFKLNVVSMDSYTDAFEGCAANKNYEEILYVRSAGSEVTEANTRRQFCQRAARQVYHSIGTVVVVPGMGGSDTAHSVSVPNPECGDGKPTMDVAVQLSAGLAQSSFAASSIMFASAQPEAGAGLAAVGIGATLVRLSLSVTGGDRPTSAMCAVTCAPVPAEATVQSSWTKYWVSESGNIRNAKQTSNDMVGSWESPGYFHWDTEIVENGANTKHPTDNKLKLACTRARNWASYDRAIRSDVGFNVDFTKYIRP